MYCPSASGDLTRHDCDRPEPRIPDPAGRAAAGRAHFLDALGAPARSRRIRRPGLLYVAYLPICGLFSLNASVAEHWLYVPGAFLLLAALLSAARIPLSRPAGYFHSCIWAGFLGVRTFLRNPDWHDQRTFLERTIADGGDSARMLINLGDLELTEGHARLAIADFQNALTLSPDQPFGLIGLGSAYLHEKQYELAREQFGKRSFPITKG